MKRRSVSFFFSPLDCLYTHAFLAFLAMESLVSFRPECGTVSDLPKPYTFGLVYCRLTGV